MRRIAATAISLSALLLLAGCSSAADATNDASSSESQPADEKPTAAEPLTLVGDWTQTNSNSDTSYQRATITDDAIVVDWVNEEDDTTALYWAGTYIAPAEDADSYTWDSANDISQTEHAILASDAATKTFTYEDGKLMYEVTAMGATVTVELAQQ